MGLYLSSSNNLPQVLSTSEDSTSIIEVDAGSASISKDFLQSTSPNLEEKGSSHLSPQNQKKGIAVIFNIVKCEGHPERKGSNADVDYLKKVFKSMHFSVQTETNPTAEKMIEVADEVAKNYNSEYICFIMCILTHGEADGVIYGSDGKAIYMDALTEPFKMENCPNLKGKPKIYLIQACQGNKEDPGVKVPISKEDIDGIASFNIPLETEFLCAYSTVPGNVAYRDDNKGSWFIQTLCEQLEKNRRVELIKILTKVNREVTVNYDFEQKKQMPYFLSFLTKDFIID